MASVSEGNEFDVVPTRLAVKAMRDSGYKNAAYAIAELVDNAVQAGAKTVEVLCREEEEFVKERARLRAKEVAVLDDGCGMSAETLRKALQFGNGERLNDRSGIGRFGMGLPNSSISQARRVDVWTWQEGHGSALHSHLDLDEIEQGELRSVPPPQSRRVPEEWLRVSQTAQTSRSGTLVVWSKLDKCDWRTAKAIFKNSELLMGRIYRYFLRGGEGRIRMASFTGHGREVTFDEDARPNDPLYLMRGTSTPEPWESEPMFEPYGEPEVIKVRVGDGSYDVKVTISHAKKEARLGHNAGGAPHGKHAAGNLGVSVVRAGRELEMQTGWCIGYDPTERWWGVEVDFPPALDEVFGVPNNKQSARALAEFASLTLEQVATREGYESEHALREAWQDEGDPRFVLVAVKHHIEKNLKLIRDAQKAQRARSEKRTRHDDVDSAETRGKVAAEQRERAGHVGGSDAHDPSPPEEKIERIATALTEAGLPEDEARPIGVKVVENRAKFEFYKVPLESAEFFTVKVQAGAIFIGLNTNHRAYDHLIALLETGDQSHDVETLKRRLYQSYEGLKLLLESWARYEDELSGRKRELAQEMRVDWGRVARDFFRDE